MADGGDTGALRDRVTKLEFEASQRPTKEYVQTEDEKLRNWAAALVKDELGNAFKLIDERLGANRSAILTDIAKDHMEFKSEFESFLKDLMVQELPRYVKAENDRLLAEKELADEKQRAAEDKAKDAREKKWLKIKLRLVTAGAVVSLLTLLVSFWFTVRGETEPREVRNAAVASDRLTEIVE